MEADTDAIVIPPAPKTVRGFPSALDRNQNNLLYFNGNAVIIRSLSSHQVLVLNHVSDVAAAKISHDGMLVASIDMRGTLVISEIAPNRIIEVYKYEGIFPNAKDIGWSADRKKVCIVGEGKNKFAKVISIETGIAAGDIVSVTSTLNSCSFRPERPYKLVLGGDEYTVKCYDGPPYSFVKSDKSHSNFILKVSYSPKGTYFLTTGADRKLIIYDGKSYEKLAEKENAHGGSIFGSDWLSDEEFATVSSDKYIKVWNAKLEEKTVIETASPEDMKNPKKFGLFLVAIRASQDKLYVATLEGDILVLSYPFTSNENSPLIRLSGNRSKIVKFLVWDQSFLVLLDSGGRVLGFDTQSKRSVALATELEMNTITTGFLTQEEGTRRLFILTGNGEVWMFEGKSPSQLKLSHKIENVEFKDIAEAFLQHHIVALTNNKIILFNAQTNKIDQSASVNEDITCLQTCHHLVLAGTIKGKVHIFSQQLQPIHVHPLNNFKITNISLYPTPNSNAFRCLLGDSCGNMSMIEVSPEGAKIAKETMGGHSSVITGSGREKGVLYTFSMDGKICVWQDDSLQRVGEIKQTVNGGIVSGCVFSRWIAVSGGNLVSKLIPQK